MSALVALTACAGRGEESSDATACVLSELTASNAGFFEARGEGAEAWALFFRSPPWEVGQDVKVAWKMRGTRDFDVRAPGPDGETVGPMSGPTGHFGSNWDRPGSEWGTFFTVMSEGCWRLEARRGAAVPTVRVAVEAT